MKLFKRKQKTGSAAAPEGGSQVQALKIKKAPILVPLLLLAAALAGYTALQFRGVSAAGSLSLGRQYLTDLNYEGAIAAFTQAIELDPANREARIGLARAYAGTEAYGVAEQVLEEMAYAEQPDEEAAGEMVDILRRSGKPEQAAQLTQTLIETTDRDEYYTLLQELLTEIYAVPRSYAAGTDQALKIRGGQVLSRGENTLGQLGTDPAAVASSGRFSSAGFSGTAVKVACAGRTSFVVDSGGGLWAAGENRWGQMGEGYAITSPESGWTQIPCPGPVADAAGTTGRLLVLLEDGSLWSSGADGSQTLRRLRRFPAVIRLAASQNQAAVLTAGGRLYRSYAGAPGEWELAASGVYAFSLSEDTLCWVKSGHELGSDNGRVSYQPGWDGETGPDVSEIVSIGGETYYTTPDGELYRFLDDGTGERIPCDPVAALYPQGELVILEHPDGSAEYLPSGGRLLPLENL